MQREKKIEKKITYRNVFDTSLGILAGDRPVLIPVRLNREEKLADIEQKYVPASVMQNRRQTKKSRSPKTRSGTPLQLDEPDEDSLPWHYPRMPYPNHILGWVFAEDEDEEESMIEAATRNSIEDMPDVAYPPLRTANAKKTATAKKNVEESENVPEISTEEKEKEGKRPNGFEAISQILLKSPKSSSSDDAPNIANPTPNHPPSTPPQPQSTSPQPQSTPPQPLSTPPQPLSTPLQPLSTPPQPLSTPPQPPSTPAQPQSTPPQPLSTPPQPPSTPLQPLSTPPQPLSTPPQPQSTPAQPQSRPSLQGVEDVNDFLFRHCAGIPAKRMRIRRQKKVTSESDVQ